MIQTLRIRNLALLEEVSLDFEQGFTVVTGETGAGKSILLGALSLLAGERADKTVIRQGASACEIEASLYFEKPADIDAVLSSLELPPCEEGLLLIRRSLPREKAPRITVNGSLATLAALQRLGEHWIDFHGPSEPRRLLKESCQLELLDLYARNTREFEAYSERHRAWKNLQAEEAKIRSEARLTPEQISFLEAQLSKLDSLNLDEDALRTLERDHSRAGKAQELMSLSSTLESGLMGEEGISSRLSALLREARQLESIDPGSKPLADRLGSAVIELADLGAEFASLAQEFHFDPEEAARLEEQMAVWLDARRRHGGTLETVALAREDMRRRLSVQGDIEGTLRRLAASISIAELELRGVCAKLRETREKAARDLAKVATKAIVQLGFKRAEFQIRLESLPDFSSSGDCRCEFLFSPNVGEAPLPLSRIASSGELARVMLALKTILADLDGVPVLVFDEVDANVGGEIGRVVGEKMAAIARGHQVFCVTHLPQVAALGTCHLLVEKDQSGERASVSISPLHTKPRARVSEIARMLGDRTARSALTHAEELLSGTQ